LYNHCKRFGAFGADILCEYALSSTLSFQSVHFVFNLFTLNIILLDSGINLAVVSHKSSNITFVSFNLGYCLYKSSCLSIFVSFVPSHHSICIYDFTLAFVSSISNLHFPSFHFSHQVFFHTSLGFFHAFVKSIAFFFIHKGANCAFSQASSLLLTHNLSAKSSKISHILSFSFVQYFCTYHFNNSFTFQTSIHNCLAIFQAVVVIFLVLSIFNEFLISVGFI